MKTFKQYLEVFGFVRYDADIPDQDLLRKIAIIRKDPRFAEYDDQQIETMLLHHTPEEVLKYGPDECLSRYMDLSVKDALDLGDFEI